MHVFSASSILLASGQSSNTRATFSTTLSQNIYPPSCSVTLPAHRYNEALDQMGLATLATRRQNLTNTLFKNIVNDSGNKLHNLLLPVTPD
jgi:hypothetical protein